MSVSQVWLSSLLSHLLKCMMEGASVQFISEIVQMFSLPSISKGKGWEGLSSMKLSFGNFKSEFWLGSNLSKISWKTTNPQIFELSTVMRTL